MTLLQRFVWFLIPVACPVLALAAEYGVGGALALAAAG